MAVARSCQTKGGGLFRSMADIDQRSRRTRNALASALMRLAREKPIDEISVRELAQAAGIGRSTFYAHFADLPDFLRKSYANMIERAALLKKQPPDSVLSVHHILQHMAQSGKYGTVLRQSRQWPSVAAAARDRLELLVATNLVLLEPEMACALRKRAAALIAGGFIALVEQWTEGGRSESPNEIEATFDCFANAVRNALSASPDTPR